jgi:hypothetical protein
MQKMHRRLFFLVVVVVAVVGLAFLRRSVYRHSDVAAQSSCEWPTVHHDVTRSGYSPCEARPPFAELWHKEWEGEMMATGMEAIVADNRVFVGTYAGKMRALDADTGHQLWTFVTGSRAGIAHSPAVSGDTLVFGTVGGSIYGLNTSNGRERWEFRAHGPGGFLSSPAIHNGVVFMGSEDGHFYAVALSDGRLVWEREIGAPVLNTAAVVNGVVYFGAEDMRVYALNGQTGALTWRSDKLHGITMRDYYPVVAGNAIILRTVPPTEFKLEDLEPDGLFLEAFNGTSSEEQDAIISRLNSNRDLQTFYVLDRDTGQERFVAPVLYGPAGNGGMPPPPVVMGDGLVVTYYRTDNSVWELGRDSPRHENFAIGTLNMSTGRIQQLRHNQGSVNDSYQTGWWCIGDESTVLSAGGSIVYNTHQGQAAGFDTSTGAVFPVFGLRDTWGGKIRPTWAGNEWHGPARGSVAIVDDRVYWIVGSRVIAIQGH